MKRSAAQTRLAAALWLSFPQVVLAAPPLAEPPVLIRDAALGEISGCAASRAVPGRLWVHNDSGNPPFIYALDTQGHVQARVRLDGVVNLDWEDIAGFLWRGRPYLALADTGDNFAIRDSVAVLLLPEPDGSAATVRPERTIEVRYPDGPRDLESIAVDAAAGQILLLEKRRPPATLYAVALDGPTRQTARPIATLADWWPEPPTPSETIGDRRYRAAATAIDLSPDGRRLAVLSNTHWAVFTRADGESWQTVLARRPSSVGRLPRRALPVHDTIFEALCWDPDGERLWISGERLPAPLLPIAVPP
ncbi:MAG: hypothetical protein QM661_15090 [Solimonas sp.]